MDRGRMLGGGSLVALGAVLLAGRLDLVDAGSVIAGWWPLVVIAAGLLRLLDRDRTGGVVIAGIGLVLLGWRQDVWTAELWQWLAPALLIALGAMLLLRRPRARPAVAATGLGDASRGTVGPVIDVVAVLAGRELRAQAGSFQGGSAVAVLGSAELDLTPAHLGPEGARLELTAVLGSVEVQVPDDWHVRIEGPAILGGIEDRTSPAPEGAPLLVIRAVAFLGGVEVVGRAARRPSPPPATGAAGPAPRPAQGPTRPTSDRPAQGPTELTSDRPEATGREKEPT
jgi:hypothetical protein